MNDIPYWLWTLAVAVGIALVSLTIALLLTQ